MKATQIELLKKDFYTHLFECIKRANGEKKDANML